MKIDNLKLIINNVLLSVLAERMNQERPRCTLRSEQIRLCKTVLRDSLRSNKSSHCLKAPFFNRRICCLPLTSSNSLMLGIVQVNLALPSLNRDFLAIATLVAPSQPPPKGEGIRRDIISPIGTTDHRRDLIPHCFQRYRHERLRVGA